MTGKRFRMRESCPEQGHSAGEQRIVSGAVQPPELQSTRPVEATMH